MAVLEMNLYEYGYFLGAKCDREKITLHRNVNVIKLEEYDRKLLCAIKNNARLPYQSISKRIGLTRNAIKHSISRMETQCVIAGYKLFVDFRHFGMELRNRYELVEDYESVQIVQDY